MVLLIHSTFLSNQAAEEWWCFVFSVTLNMSGASIPNTYWNSTGPWRLFHNLREFQEITARVLSNVSQSRVKREIESQSINYACNCAWAFIQVIHEPLIGQMEYLYNDCSLEEFTEINTMSAHKQWECDEVTDFCRLQGLSVQLL
jgi:hypothetical protein